MTLKLGISIYSIPNLSVETLISFVNEKQFSAIELWSTSFDSLNKDISDFLINMDKTLSIHAPLLNLGSKAELNKNIKELKNTILLAKQYNARNIVLHIGEIDSEQNIELSKNIEIAKKVIINNIELLEENNILLSIENVGYAENELIKSYEQLKNFVDSFDNSNIGITFDLAHANVTEGVENGFKKFGSRINHLHLSDNFGDIEKHHKPLGDGNINFEILKRFSFQNEIYAILEIEQQENWKNNLLSSRKLLEKHNILNSKIK